MAKSLRSKWKRKCRAVKRERYAVKELARLKKTLEIDGAAPKEVEMTDISEIATGKISRLRWYIEHAIFENDLW